MRQRRHDPTTQVHRVVNDDESVREALPDLLRELGYKAEGFSSADEFLASDKLKQAVCLVLDIMIPDISGLDLQRQLLRQKQTIPVIFITAHGDEAVGLLVRRAGAAECLFGPFSDNALLEALQTVFILNRQNCLV